MSNILNQEALDLIGQGVDTWNRWRDTNPEKMPILFGANLSNTNLNGINLSNTYLVEASFRVANLSNANLSGASLSRADLWGANLTGADLTKANLTGATLIRTNLSKAILVDCAIYGASAWGVILDETKQENLLISDYGDPIITVDNLEMAQFIYLLLNHKKLQDAINTITKRGVLILGRFGSGGLEVLQAIAVKLRVEGYLPIIFDFERPRDRNYTETVKTLAGLSRFVIVDLSGPSVPQELYATVPHFKIPFVPILETSRKTYSMVTDIFEYSWVIRPPITFNTIEELIEQISTKIITQAEEKHQDRQKLLDELFNKISS